MPTGGTTRPPGRVEPPLSYGRERCDLANWPDSPGKSRWNTFCANWPLNSTPRRRRWRPACSRGDYRRPEFAAVRRGRRSRTAQQFSCPPIPAFPSVGPGSSSTVCAYATFNHRSNYRGMKIYDLSRGQPDSHADASIVTEREPDTSRTYWQAHLPVREGGLWEPGNFRMWGVPDGH